MQLMLLQSSPGSVGQEGRWRQVSRPDAVLGQMRAWPGPEQGGGVAGIWRRVSQERQMDLNFGGTRCFSLHRLEDAEASYRD